jgi:rod shape-determining protein MreB
MHQDDGDILYVGIDLGTSRSSIATSDGTREWVQSFVGWPKDFIAEKTLGKSVLCGKEALEHRLSLDLYRPLQHGIIKDGIDKNEQAVAELVRHLLSLAKPSEGQKIHAVVGVPAEALKVNKIAIKNALKGQVDRLMVVSEPFAVAYGRDLLDNAMTVDIGAGTVDFCIMHGTVPGDDDQKTIMAAGDSIDERLESLLQDAYPAERRCQNCGAGYY